MTSICRISTKKAHAHIAYSEPMPKTLSEGQRKKVAAQLETLLFKAINPREFASNALLKTPLMTPTNAEKITHREEYPYLLTFSNAPVDICHTTLKELDPTAFMNCTLINSHWNRAVKSLCANMPPIDLQKICPMLTIIDATLIKKERKLEILGEPPIHNFEVIMSVRDLAHRVMGNHGLTLLTVPSASYTDASLSNLSAGQLHISSHTFPDELQEQKISTCTRRKLITNCILENSQDTTCSQKKRLLLELKCTMPTNGDYILLCSLTYDIFEKILYPAEKNHRGQSSTQISHKGKITSTVVAFYTTSHGPTLQTHICTYFHKGKVGVGALRTFLPKT